MVWAVVIVVMSGLGLLGSLVLPSVVTLTVASVVVSIAFHAIYMYALYKRCERTPKRNAPWVLALIIIFIDAIAQLKQIGKTIVSVSTPDAFLFNLAVFIMGIAVIVLTSGRKGVQQ